LIMPITAGGTSYLQGGKREANREKKEVKLRRRAVGPTGGVRKGGYRGKWRRKARNALNEKFLGCILEPLHKSLLHVVESTRAGAAKLFILEINKVWLPWRGGGHVNCSLNPKRVAMAARERGPYQVRTNSKVDDNGPLRIFTINRPEYREGETEWLYWLTGLQRGITGI